MNAVTEGQRVDTYFREAAREMWGEPAEPSPIQVRFKAMPSRKPPMGGTLSVQAHA